MSLALDVFNPTTRRERLRARRRTRPSKITIPAGVSPYVKLVFEEMRRQRVGYDEVEEMSGVLRATLKAWRHKNKPGIASIEAVLGCLGWDFVPVCRAKVLPKPLVADLEVVAAKHGLSETETIQALIMLVARGQAPSTAPSLDDMATGIGGTDAVSA